MLRPIHGGPGMRTRKGKRTKELMSTLGEVLGVRLGSLLPQIPAAPMRTLVLPHYPLIVSHPRRAGLPTPTIDESV